MRLMPHPITSLPHEKNAENLANNHYGISGIPLAPNCASASFDPQDEGYSLPAGQLYARQLSQQEPHEKGFNNEFIIQRNTDGQRHRYNAGKHLGDSG